MIRMSFAMTTAQVLAQTKTQTRRPLYCYLQADILESEGE